MAIIKVLKDEELVGGIDNTDVYPVTHTKAVYDNNNKQLDARLNENDSDRSLLHRESEKIVAYITTEPKDGTTIEITGNPNKVTITGWGKIENYGDEPYRDVPKENIDNYYDDTALPEESYENQKVISHFTFPDTVGSYKFSTEATDGAKIIKIASSTLNVNLRKYFGFSSNSVTDITVLGTSHFSNSVGCTVTIPAINNGYQPIYFAVPSNMSISRVVQPDALNAPLSIVQLSTINRNINGVNHTYKLYKSTDDIDTTVSKRLTIS